jgi:hypothetical protein
MGNHHFRDSLRAKCRIFPNIELRLKIQALGFAEQAHLTSGVNKIRSICTIPVRTKLYGNGFLAGNLYISIAVALILSVLVERERLHIVSVLPFKSVAVDTNVFD